MTARLLKLSLIFCITTSIVRAQDLNFDKKSGEFTNGTTVIAKLEDEKNRSQGGKNYFIKDSSDQTELLAFILHKFEDTMGSASVYYYEMRCTPLNLSAYRPNFTGMLNTFKEVGEMVLAKNLIQPDAKINESNMRSYFAAATSDMGDYPKILKAKNDSMEALVNIDAPPVERDMRKPVTANEYGKIGQGNTVIGNWEFIENKGTGINSSTYLFRIKNLAGGIICISWISLSGAHTYTYKGGARSQENWKVPDLINNNPIQHKQEYVEELSRDLIRAGLL